MEKKHSDAYKLFIKQLGNSRRDGYHPQLLELIDPDEREEIEKIIIDRFQKGDVFMATFLPKVEWADGIALLKNELMNAIKPSGKSVEIAKILYLYSGNQEYLDIIISNLASTRVSDREAAVVALLDLVPNEQIYYAFKKACLDDNDIPVRINAALGILLCKGVIRDPFSLDEKDDIVEALEKRLYSNDRNTREEVIRYLEEFQIV